MPLKERLRLVVRLDSDSASLDSISPVWPAANFYEREIFDLFGVHFGGHPNLRRIMMPEDWNAHPLRKDYPVEGYRSWLLLLKISQVLKRSTQPLQKTSLIPPPLHSTLRAMTKP